MNILHYKKKDNVKKTLISQSNYIKKKGFLKLAIQENKDLLGENNFNGLKILEFGCGIIPASYGIQDSYMPKKYLATDFSNEILKKTRLIDPRIDFLKINLNLKNKNIGKYDIIIFKGVLHHLKNYGVVLYNSKKYLKKNGFILISEPNLKSIVGNILKYLMFKLFKINMEDSPYGQIPYNDLILEIKKNNFVISTITFSRFLAFMFSGCFGRINIFKNFYIINFFIYLDILLKFILSFIGLEKYFFFLVNLKIYKK